MCCLTPHRALRGAKEMIMNCPSCNDEIMTRRERNTRPVAEILYVCPACGLSTKRIDATDVDKSIVDNHFPEPPAVGEWVK